ncbi:abhydrolase domain-containing protein 5 [Coccidioides immitis H538.4]|uniref:Abhydrolase domain-containing protein 5 n=1 Tax=Coccidioides immitis H538.4 TaxID=396776 RepID=A0A0J8RNV6_COCIT|nr:abhydrolase domain-containing protein 5 [Coccidioides immitis H538.4]
MTSATAAQPSGDTQTRQPQAPLASTRPEARPPAPLSRLFPLGYKEGFSQWWASIPAAAAEHKVLSFIPYLQRAPTHTQTGTEPATPNEQTDTLTSADHTRPGQVSENSVNDPYGPRRWRSTMVELSGKNRELNEFSVERLGEKVENNLVVLHGYGAGLGFFYKNFEALSRAKGWQLYALDLLGMGRSTRPPFRIAAKEREKAIKEAEDWFVDALEEWRVKRRIERFTLLGHSLGGYLAVAYALKYPGRLNKLILASPVGIPEDPYARAAASVDNNDISKPPAKTIPKWLVYLWDANVSPFSLVRWSGPLGPRLVSGWTSRRFSHLPQDEARALHDYAYSLFRLRGSGEYALSYILAPGAYARSPVIRRIHGVGRQFLPPQVNPPSPKPDSASESTSLSCSDLPPPSSAPSAPSASDSSSSFSVQTAPRREPGIPIVFMYGEHDWMDAQGGHAAKEKIDQEKQRILKDASVEEQKADKGSAKVVVIKKAGHHLYLDGWEEFNEVMLDEMKDVSENHSASPFASQ